MTTQRRTLIVDDAALDSLRRPHDGLVLEQQISPDRFTLAEGPFKTYERTLDVVSRDDHEWEVAETTTWQLGIPVFWIIVWFPFWFHVRSGQKNPSPWWAPSGRFDSRAGRVIGLLGVLAIINGFLGTVIGQTLTFAADEFCTEFVVELDGRRRCIDPDHDTSARANVFSIVRVSVVLSLLLTVAADRIGRRRALTIAIVTSCVATLAGAFAPSLTALTVTQIFARGLATGVTILIGVFACLLYTSPSPRDQRGSRMPSSA